MKVAIIGTVGVPANYGGFETLVENLLLHNISDNLQYSVYCSTKNYAEKRWVYKGAKMVYIPLKANGIQSVVYDIVSIIKAVNQSDVLLILGVSGCIIFPLLRLFSKKRIVINIDGLEHRRDKWRKSIRKFLKFSESLAIKYADVIIADNKGIWDYVEKEYGKDSRLIEYGGDHIKDSLLPRDNNLLKDSHLSPKNYSLAICRIEPENNVQMILNVFKRSKENLVFIGNWGYSDFSQAMFNKYNKCSNIKLLGPIYDINILNEFRLNCKNYIHGHSAGGTNPSLVEAMYLGCPIFAFDVIYNKETTEGKARYFKNEEELAELILMTSPEDAENNGTHMKEISHRRYLWNIIVDKYVECFSIT